MFSKIKRFFFKDTSKTVLLKQPETKEIAEEILPSKNDQKVHLGVIVGHTKKQGGAVLLNGSMNEYQYNKKVLDAMVKNKDIFFPRLELTPIFRDDIGIAGAYDRARGLGCDCVVELHFNASNGRSSGSLTLCTSSSDDIEFAHEVHNHICTVFGRIGSSRGVAVIGRSVRGAANIYAFPEGANCLVEPFFGDSPEDGELGIKKIDEYATAILQAVNNWAKKRDLIS